LGERIKVRRDLDSLSFFAKLSYLKEATSYIIQVEFIEAPLM